MFASGNRRRFNTPAWKKSRCSKLVVNGEVVSDPEVLLEVSMKHFCKSAKSRGDVRFGRAAAESGWIGIIVDREQ